ncbi:Ig-like domain-containing protein [Edaphobacter albus]|uniref:Ig-like domain-containing protein n=1 Tax=Edaphobacter sp. 4G125 TaxID=2763071 RepID=UPI001647D2A7|nr:Ig-like domain-containing protein [Edaphobacter sp. 4G125]QNI37354.1 Ig-like domain repeat protein [Edaphobacter sp. 4G125]
MKYSLLFLLCLNALFCRGQTVVVQTQNGTANVNNSGYSAYGYPWSALAGSDREQYVSVFAEVDNITAWSGDGSSVTFTTNNHLSANDVVSINYGTSPGWPFNWKIYQVVSATPTSFTISDGTVGSGSESTATVSKRSGAGFSSLGTWEIINTIGSSETYKLYTQDGTQATGFSPHPIISGAPQFINFVVGSIPGSCFTTGSIATGDFAIHSTIEFDIKFTSADDSTKTGSYHYVVCANGGGTGYSGVAHVSPGYRQVFKNRYIPLAGQVFGNTNQMIDWTIVSAPAGGDAQLLYSNFPQPVFYSGTIAGQYAIRGCPHVDHSPGACDELAVWVSPNNSPSGNVDRVEQVPCDVDTTMQPATIIDIGPSQTFPDLLAVPQNYAAPLLVRVHNEGGDGNPTVYHNQLQVNIPSSGSWDDRHPAVLLCGVPNPRTGELPIIDGENATTNSWTSPWVVAPYGLISFVGVNAGPQVNDGRVKPFHHVTVSGLHIRNVTSGFSYFDQSGASGTWGGSMGFRPFGVQYWSVIGTHAENVATPYFDDCNTQVSGWSACTLDTFYEGNHGEGYGRSGSYTEHMFYLQAFRDTSMLNLQDGGVQGDQGTTCFSDRGTRSFHMYSRCVPTGNYSTASVMGGHSEIQDAYNYVLPDEFWGYQGSSSCATTYSIAPGCAGAFGGEDWFAALTEEHNNSDFVIGNYYVNASGGTKYLGIATTHNTTGIDNSSQGFYAYNTLLYSPLALQNDGGFLWEDTRLGPADRFTDAYLPATWPRAQIQNNIIPWKDNTNCAYRCSVLSTSGHSQLTFQTNLIAPGQITVAPNIQPTGWLAGGIFHNGVNTSWSYFDPGNIVPINHFLAGFTSSNFIPYNFFPVDTNTGRTVSGSNAIGAALPLSGQLSYYPPRFNPVTSNLDPFVLRTDLTTIGATDPGNVPALTSIAVTPNPASITRSGTIQLTATCKFADSSISDCTHSASWSTASSAFHLDATSPGLVYGDNVGSGAITATIGSVSGTATINVTNSSPVLASIAITPNPAQLITAGTLQLKAICTYTDASISDCTNSVSWSTSSLYFRFDNSIPGLIHGYTPGTGTASAFVGSVVANSTVNVVQLPAASTTTILTSSVNPSANHQLVTFTATVAAATRISVPTGTVQLKADGTNIGNPVHLINGVAQFSLNSLEVGRHTIVATYTPDSGSYAMSTGSIIQHVNSGQKGSTTVALTISPNPSTVGQSIYITATVSSGATGTVQFVEGATVLGTSTISGTTATFTTASLPAGTHLVNAIYGGDNYYRSATSATATQVVRSALGSSVPELTLEPSNSVYGQPVTVTISVPKTGSTIPTGTVVIYYNGKSIRTGNLGTNGVALVTLPGGTLPVGTGIIMASYSGDSAYAPSNTQSKSITVVSVAVLDFTLALTAGQSQTVISGEVAPIAAHIAPTSTTYPGLVTFTATGLPPGATVSFSPSILAPDGGPTPVNANVQTTVVLSGRRSSSYAASIALGILFLPLARTKVLLRNRRAMSRYLLLSISLLMGITATVGLTGCGSGYVRHTYDITITATSGTIQHSINATLNVQ